MNHERQAEGDGYSPICRGDDGELYSVLFDYGGDVPRPVIWSKVTKRDRVPEEFEIRSVNGKIGDHYVDIELLTAADGRSSLILSV